MDKEIIDPMSLGCIIFAGPFFIFVAWVTLAVIFNWR